MWFSKLCNRCKGWESLRHIAHSTQIAYFTLKLQNNHFQHSNSSSTHFFTFSYSPHFYKYIHTNNSNKGIPLHKHTPHFDYLILWEDYLQYKFATLIFKKTVRECSFPTYSVFSFYILILFYIIYTFYPYYYYEIHSHNTHFYIP